MENKNYTFELSLSLLNHLGRNLYRNFITVLGEAISNAWDADANNVWIYIDRENKKFAQAEKAGKKNVVFYTYRDLEDGFLNGVVKRMRDNPAEMGRIVPTKIIAENAPGSLNIAQELQKRGYKVYVVDNSLGKNNAKLSSFDEILKKANYSGDLKSKLNNKVKELYERGDITPEQYKAYTE